MTSNIQFSGMEASTCVFITSKLIEETGARSGLLRATSRLVVVSYTEDIDMEEVKKRFVVHDTTKLKEEWRQREEKRRKEEERKKEEERIRKGWEPLAAEVDSAAKKGDIARVKQLQQLETSGIVIIISIIRKHKNLLNCFDLDHHHHYDHHSDMKFIW